MTQITKFYKAIFTKKIMKKIETKEVIEKRRRRNQIIVGTVMIVLLVISTAGFAILNRDSDLSSQSEDTKTENGVEYYKQQNIWVTRINNKALAFSYLPSEITDVEISITSNINNLQNKPLYVVNANSAKEMIAFNLIPEFVERINDACLSSEDCLENNYPIKDCFVDNIIVYKENLEETKVYQENNCIIIEGDKAKGTDRLLQSLMGLA